MFEGSTSSHWVKVGHYDATQTFIVGPEFSSPQTFTIDTIIYGLYGPSTLTNTSVITKISSNIFKVTWSGDVGTETTYTGAVNGTMATYTFSVGWNSPIYTGSCSNGEFRMSGGDYAGSGTVYNYLTLKLP
jgi:phenolic acid decarboxylase